MLGEVARPVLNGRVVGQLSTAAAGEHIAAGAGDRLAEVAAAKGPGVTAVQNDDDVSSPRRIDELVDPRAAHRGREQIGRLGVLHTQVQSTGLIQFAVAAEIDEQDVVAFGRGEESAHRPQRPGRAGLGQQGDVGVGEQAGVAVNQRAIQGRDVFDRPLERLQVVLVGRIGRVPDQERSVLAGHGCPPTRSAAALAMSRTLSVSSPSPVRVTCRSTPFSSQRTSIRRA